MKKDLILHPTKKEEESVTDTDYTANKEGKERKNRHVLSNPACAITTGGRNELIGRRRRGCCWEKKKGGNENEFFRDRWGQGRKQKKAAAFPRISRIPALKGKGKT